MAGPARAARGRGGLDDAGRARPRGVLADPIFELLPLKNHRRPGPAPAGRRPRVGDRVAGQGDRRDARLGGPPPGRRLPGDPASVGPDDRDRGDARRPARAGPRRRADPRVRRRRRRRRAGRVPRRPVAAPGDDRARPSVRDDRLPGLSAGPPGHPRRGAGRRRSATRRRTSPTSRPRWTSTRRRSRAGSAARRAEGFDRDVVVGVPGVADPQKLLSIAARIGVKDAKRFLVKNLRFVTGLAKSGGFYKPTGFVEELAPLSRIRRPG